MSVTRRAARVLCLLLGHLAAVLAWFEEPRPLAVWENPAALNTVARKPQSLQEKSFGQWCRNFTIDFHLQCPQGSPFHWYYCCGPSNTDCCVAPQTWTIVVFGSFFVATAFLIVLSVLAHLDLIWSEGGDKPDKPISTAHNNKYNPVPPTSAALV